MGEHFVYILFLSGTFIIITVFVFLLYFRFKEDDDIDLKEHSLMLTFYIIIMLLSIYLWGLFSENIYMIMLEIQDYLESIYKDIEAALGY